MGLVETADYLKALVESNPVVPGLTDFSIEDVFYGDQENLARNITVCVDPGEKVVSQLYGSRRAIYDARHYIMAYAKTLAGSEQNRRICDLVAEHLETLVNANPKLGGTVIQSHVAEVRPGYVQRGDSIVRSTRLTVVSTTEKNLPLL